MGPKKPLLEETPLSSPAAICSGLVENMSETSPHDSSMMVSSFSSENNVRPRRTVTFRPSQGRTLCQGCKAWLNSPEVLKSAQQETDCPQKQETGCPQKLESYFFFFGWIQLVLLGSFLKIFESYDGKARQCYAHFSPKLFKQMAFLTSGMRII